MLVCNFQGTARGDSESLTVLPKIAFGEYPYGCNLIREDNAVLSPYGLLHRADYQPMLTPVQESQEMKIKMK